MFCNSIGNSTNYLSDLFAMLSFTSMKGIHASNISASLFTLSGGAAIYWINGNLI